MREPRFRLSEWDGAVDPGWYVYEIGSAIPRNHKPLSQSDAVVLRERLELLYEQEARTDGP